MDRELNRGLIRPPQVTYKELWMLGEKESNGKMRGRIEWAREGTSIFEWNFWSKGAEVCDVERKSACAGWWIDANSEFRLQLYFYVGVFFSGAGCVPGVVCVLRHGIAESVAVVCKKLTYLIDWPQPFWREAHLNAGTVLGNFKIPDPG
jgi:hypothetical protein